MKKINKKVADLFMFQLTQQQTEAVFSAMRKGGEIMRKAHDAADVESGIIEKAGTANFVTAYDVLVQKTLIEELSAILPQATFFAEEKENAQEDTRSGLCFVIDPIDGTTNFIHDFKASSVSVGLLCDGKPLFGAVYDPYRDELYWAQVGEGAYCNGKKISVSSNDLPHALIGFGTSPYYKDEIAEESFALARELFVAGSDIRRGGSAAIDFCALACGRLDVFFEKNLSPWDYMASYVIITEAGGEMLTYSGSVVSFDQPSAILCVNQVLKDDVLAITKKYC